MPVITRRLEELRPQRVALAAEQQLGAVLARVGDVALDLLEPGRSMSGPTLSVLGEAVGHRRVARAASVKPAAKSS